MDGSVVVEYLQMMIHIMTKLNRDAFEEIFRKGCVYSDVLEEHEGHEICLCTHDDQHILPCVNGGTCPLMGITEWSDSCMRKTES